LYNGIVEYKNLNININLKDYSLVISRFLNFSGILKDESWPKVIIIYSLEIVIEPEKSTGLKIK
jgi:hypothetical protein